jgi:hypothetical protein
LKPRSFSVSGEVVDEILLGGSGDEIEVTKVFSSDIGNGRICGTSRRVKNGRIYEVERRVWRREELARRDRSDGDVVRDELIVGPVTIRFSRSNKIGHNNVDI